MHISTHYNWELRTAHCNKELGIAHFNWQLGTAHYNKQLGNAHLMVRAMLYDNKNDPTFIYTVRVTFNFLVGLTSSFVFNFFFNAFRGFFNDLSCLLGIYSSLEKFSMSLVEVSSPYMHV
jgi:hypothetical protein